MSLQSSSSSTQEHALVYWPKEDSATIVLSAAIVEPFPPVLNMSCILTTSTKTRRGFLLNIGTKQAMEAYENDFLDGTLNDLLPPSEEEYKEQEPPSSRNIQRLTPKTLAFRKRTPLRLIDVNVPGSDMPQKKHLKLEPVDYKPSPTGEISDLVQVKHSNLIKPLTLAEEIAQDMQSMLQTVQRLENSVLATLKRIENIGDKIDEIIRNQSCIRSFPTVEVSNNKYNPPPTALPAPGHNLSSSVLPTPPPIILQGLVKSTKEHTRPYPIRAICKDRELPSTEIKKENLSKISDVLLKYRHLQTEQTMGSLAAKLAREAIFGEDVMKRCTPKGWTDLPALPQAELELLKTTLFELFPRFRTCPWEFERKWIQARESVEQSCKRLRKYSCFRIF